MIKNKLHHLATQNHHFLGKTPRISSKSSSVGHADSTITDSVTLSSTSDRSRPTVGADGRIAFGGLENQERLISKEVIQKAQARKKPPTVTQVFPGSLLPGGVLGATLPMLPGLAPSLINFSSRQASKTSKSAEPSQSRQVSQESTSSGYTRTKSRSESSSSSSLWDYGNKDSQAGSIGMTSRGKLGVNIGLGLKLGFDGKITL